LPYTSRTFYLIDYLLGFVGVAPVVDGDRGTLFREGECYGAADTQRRPRDHGSFVLQLQGVTSHRP
jgi:hypothetical protein